MLNWNYWLENRRSLENIVRNLVTYYWIEKALESRFKLKHFINFSTNFGTEETEDSAHEDGDEEKEETRRSSRRNRKPTNRFRLLENINSLAIKGMGVDAVITMLSLISFPWMF